MHILCPHCHSPIEVVTIRPHEEITCPSCGSSFRLETQSTTGHEQRAGQRLGKFELIDTVGQGAFGTVYMARDPELSRTVAIKVPRAGNLAGPQELDRFLREARSVAQLRHPSIVTVHEVGQSGGLPYLVSDFVRGVTLTDLMSARRPTFRESAELVAGVADALQYAHEQGVIHRDVKPSNIMIGEDGRPAVMDFGLAKRDAGEITMTIEGQVLGTPAYMSPEQARGEGHKVDGRADVYSLGVILYQLLTGELPFRGTQRMLLHQVLHDEPRPPRSLNDRIPRDLETITLKAMSKEPARRYTSARALADDLRNWLKGDPIRARPVGRAEKLARWCRRNPVVAALVAGIIGVTLLGLAGVTWQWQLADTRADSEAEARKDAQIAQNEEVRQRAEAEANLRQARLNLYASLLARADAALNGHRLAEAQQVLLDCPHEHRGWEWKYLLRQCLGTPHVLLGHTAPVDCVAYSPDGKLLASCSRHVNHKDGIFEGGEVILWDIATGQAVHTFRDSHYDFSSVAFSPDSQRLAAAGALGQWDERANVVQHFRPVVKVWDTKTSQEVFTLNAEDDTRRVGPTSAAVAFSPDGRMLAWGRIIGATTEQEDGLYVAAKLAGMSLAEQSLGKIWWQIGPWNLLSGRAFKSTVTVHDATNGRQATATSSSSFMIGDLAWDRLPLGVVGLAFSQDARRLAVAENCIVRFAEIRELDPGLGKWSGRVRVWDLASGNEAFRLSGPVESTDIPDWPELLGPIVGVAFSLDGHRIAASGNAFDHVKNEFKGSVVVWDSRTGQELRRNRSFEALTASVVFSRDGHRLACADSPDVSKEPLRLKVWDAATFQELANLKGHPEKVRALAFSPDGNQLASGSEDKTVRLWNLRSEPGRTALPGRMLALSQDGRRLATIENRGPEDMPVEKTSIIRVWDTGTLRPIATFAGPRQGADLLAFRADGQRVVIVSKGSQEITEWNVNSGQKLATVRNEQFRFGLTFTFSPDAERIACPEFRSNPGQPGEHYVAVRSTTTGETLFTIDGLRSEPRSVLFRRDGKRLAVGFGPLNLSPGQSNTPQIRVYDGQSGRLIFSRTLRGHGVSSLAFSEDVGRLAFVQDDGRRWVCDAETGLELDELPYFSARSFNPALSADGQRLTTSDDDGVIRFWDVKGKQLLYSLRTVDRWPWRVQWLPGGQRLAAEGESEVKLLETGLVPSVELGLEAHILVDQLFHELFARDAVIERLREDKSRPPQLLDEAVRVAATRPELHPIFLARHSASLSVLPGLKRAAYQPALHQAEAAYRGAPDNVEVLFALAMARYRLEKYKEAHEAMAPVAGLRPPWSLDSALQALISFRLGRAEEARAYLAKAQEQYKANPWEETAVLIREAEELLAQEGK